MKAPVSDLRFPLRFSDSVEQVLNTKVIEHNREVLPGRHATLHQLRRVYRRGAGAYTPSTAVSMTRSQSALARVSAYLHLLKHGKPSHPSYTEDYDVLPVGHPCSTKGQLASIDQLVDGEIYVELKPESDYSNPEHALIAFAEVSGLGYEILPALRAAWLRAALSGDEPFDRARELATKLYDSKDFDLLPYNRKG